MRKIQLPCIHSNGTSAQELATQMEEAIRAISSAIKALENASPNARDYYPLGQDAFRFVSEEHLDRVNRLAFVERDLYQILEHITDSLDS